MAKRSPPGLAATLTLCFLACIIEGADIVSMGLAAPQVARAFGFGPGQMSYVLTAAVLGLMAGAGLGGRLGDRVGRRAVVIAAFVTFGLFSLATARASSLDAFVVVRFGCGVGLGAALPNLIAIAAEAARPNRRATMVGAMFAGQPAGGAMLGLLVAAASGRLPWTAIFYLGGILPLLLLPLLVIGLPEPATFRAARRDAAAPPIAAALFGEGRMPITLLLWAAYGLTQVVVYLINNWLPTLMVAKGFTPAQAGAISACENAGAVAGCVALAMAADRRRVSRVLVATCLGMTAGLGGLAAAQAFGAMMAAGVVTGFFVIGGQLVLYTLPPLYYPTLTRATGTGAAVSVGRLGGVVGPFAAGQLLALDVAPALVLVAAMPCVLLAGAAAVTLTARRWPPG